MRHKELYKIISAYNPEAKFADGFEEALIGYTQSSPSFCAVYDIEKCIAILIERGMSLEGAVEYFDYNVLGSYVGEHTPVFVSL